MVATAFGFEAEPQHQRSQTEENIRFSATGLFILVFWADISQPLFLQEKLFPQTKPFYSSGDSLQEALWGIACPV